MRLHRVLWLIFALSAPTLVAAADPPYAGKWKMNVAKSDFGQQTVTYEQVPSGEMQATASGQSLKFPPFSFLDDSMRRARQADGTSAVDS